MSYYKRNRRAQGTGQRPPDGPAARESVQILQMTDFNLRKEMDYIVQAASRGDARVVTVGALVFFSTSDGDAWVLDAEDKLALCLMRDFERYRSEVQETPENLSIRWKAMFAIESGCFWVTGQPAMVEVSPQSPTMLRTKAVAYPSYPVTDLQRAIQRARKAVGLS